MTNADPGEPALTRDPALDDVFTEARVSGHVRTFSVFYREFFPRLVAFLLWIGARLPDAADIAQETMIRVHQNWERIEKPEAYAFTVASREYAGRIASIKEDPADAVESNPLLAPDADMTAFEERHEVLRLLKHLPPRQRQVMGWSYDGYTPEEIAAELSISGEAVRSSLLKARRTLVHHLARSQTDES